MPRPRLTIVLLLATLAAASAWSLAAPYAGPDALLLEGVPDVEQTTNYSCGPSCLTAVLAFYGIHVPEAEVISAAKTNPDVGAELEHLAEVAERHGLKATVREGMTMEELERELSSGRPVIILNQSWRTDLNLRWTDAWDDGHYVVALGMDERHVYVEDPVLMGSRGFIPRREFVERWHCWTIDQRKVNGQALLVHGPAPQEQPRRIKRLARVE